jgi:hypothetical protein
MLEGDRHDLARVEREREKVWRVAMRERERARPGPGLLLS